MGDKKIYHSFEDFLESNRSLFQWIEKSVSTELLRAVWNARQGEVEHRDERIRVFEEDAIVREEHGAVLERELVERKRLAREREKGMEELRERLSLLEMEREILSGQSAEIQEEVERVTKERDSLKDSFARLEKNLAEKCHQLEEKSLLCHKLERALKFDRAQMRTQRALNEQMSEELSRLAP